MIDPNPLVGNVPKENDSINPIALPPSLGLEERLNAQEKVIENLTKNSTDIQNNARDIQDIVKEQQKEIKDQNNLMILGFLIMLVMVATLVFQVFGMFSESNRAKEAQFERLNDTLRRIELIK